MNDFDWIKEAPIYHKDKPVVGMKFMVDTDPIVYTITDEDDEYFYLDFTNSDGRCMSNYKWKKESYEHFMVLCGITVINE